METTTEKVERKDEWTRERVELIRRTVVPKGIPEDEFDLFIEQCKRSGLDPLLKEAFCVGRRHNAGTRDKPYWTTKYEFQPSEAGMLTRAERFPEHLGCTAAAVYAEDEILMDAGAGTVRHTFNPAKRKGALAGAWGRVERRGMTPILVWLDFAGYVQQTPLWSKIPATMIEKCARVAALRKAYPGAFGGLYVKEEMEGREGVAFEDAPVSPALPPEPAAPAVPREAQEAAERVQRAVGGETQAAGPTVTGGPHKGTPIRALNDDALAESIAYADGWLKQNGKKARREQVDAASAQLVELIAERDMRSATTAPGAH